MDETAPVADFQTFLQQLADGGRTGLRILLTASPDTPPELRPTAAQVSAAQQLVVNAQRAEELLQFEARIAELERRLEEKLKELES